VRGALEVKGFRVQLAHETAFEQLLADVAGEGYPTWVAWPTGPLTSRERVHWRVQVETEQGWSSWAEDVVEAALDDADWIATPVGGNDGVLAPRLSTRFRIDQPVARARLYVTALGVHESAINGRPVGEDVLAPGWTAYQHRLAYDTYDVADLLVQGENELAGIVGDGWYRGNLVWGDRRHRNHYGPQTALLAQLEVTCIDGSTLTVATGPDWTAETTEVLSNDLYDGTATDLTAATRPLDLVAVERPAQLVVREGPPVRRTEVFSSEPRAGLHDFGQNLTGWLRVRVRAQAGQTLTARHAEVLLDDELATEPLRTAKATDTWVMSEGEHLLEPRFTFHGFRYAELVTDAEVLSVQAVAVHSDLERTAHFACSDERLNQLHSNVVWGQRGNFLSVPTDCPQRDERLGWTGDAQVFAKTASLLHDCRGFFADWLADLRLEQLPTGSVPVVVPNVLSPDEAGIGGWADAAVVVPWEVAARSGDRELLRDSVASMRAWVDFVVAQLQDGLWVTGFQLGDWLDPDAPPGEAWKAKADNTMVANAVFAHSVQLLADTLDLLGQPSADYAAVAKRQREKAWERWGAEAVTTQTGCALFLRFGLVPEADRQRFADALAELVLANGGRIGTGFLGTPEVLYALSDHGRLDAAYALLMCAECPSWLYQVDRGATTMWERWDAIRPDGSLNLGSSDGNAAGMLSFNHYAYGAVASWLHEVAAGLVVTELPEPEIVVAPRPGGDLTWAEASLVTPRGTASVHWDATAVTTEIPAGYRAWLDLDGTRVALPAGRTVTPR
jgi:alpha-L-rhamnosidase